MRKNDFILIGAILAFVLIVFGIIALTEEEGNYVVVRVEGKEIARYSLLVDGVYELNGGTNTLVIKDGKAWLSHATCPDLLCVKQGKVHNDGQSIACRPNFLTVVVYGDDGSGVDLVS